jgi:hypothetical protein
MKRLRPEQTATLLLLTYSLAFHAAHACAQSTAIDQRVASLIADLGDAAFAKRERASTELLAIGEDALAQLRALPDSSSFEMRYRAELVRARIEKEKFTRLSNSFLLDLDPNHSYGLPAWSAYRDVVGASRTSKLLFLEMLREQPEVAQLIENASHAQAPQAAQTVLATVASHQAAQVRESLYLILDPKIGDVVGMLLAAATLDMQTPVEISDVIVSNERRSFGSNIQKQGYGTCLRKLMAAWIPKTHDSLAPTVMDIALRYDLAEGVDIARKHLTANFDNDTRKIAFYCLARFGNETDVASLLPLLDDEAVVDEFDRNLGGAGIDVSNAAPPGIQGDAAARENVVVRVNDLALVTIMILSNEDPLLVFPRFEPHPQFGFFVHALACPSELAEDRKQRIEQWKKLHTVGQAAS